MESTKEGIVLKVILGLAMVGVLLTSTQTYAQVEPDLLVYPSAPSIFRFNPVEYELILPGNPDFDPLYQAGGASLWDRTANRIAYEVFKAPALTGLTPSLNGRNEFVIMTNEFRVVVDGFSDYPRYLGQIYVRFAPDPPQATALIEMAGQMIDALIQPIAPINVEDETPEGYYSNSRQVHVRWSGAVGIRITAYGDKNNNMVFDGGVPRWSIYVEDNSVPVEQTTWGAIKARFED